MSALYCVAVGVTALFFDGEGVVDTVALGIFLVTCLVFGLAQVSLLRNDDDEWTFRSAFAGIAATFRGAKDGFADWWSLPPLEKRLGAAGAAFAFAALVLAIRGLVAWGIAGIGWAFEGFGTSAMPVLEFIGFFGGLSFVLSGFVWARTMWDIRSYGDEHPTMLAATESVGGDVSTIIGGLPPVLDLATNPDEKAAWARSLPDRQLGEVLAALALWNPRPRSGATEKDYQISLLRHLRKWTRRLESEKPIEGSWTGAKRRLDIAIEDTYVLELKRRANRTSEIDRMLSQVRSYAQNWANGPIIVVVCESAEDVGTGSLRRVVDDLRSMGHPVLGVAAGRRLLRGGGFAPKRVIAASAGELEGGAAIDTGGKAWSLDAKLAIPMLIIGCVLFLVFSDGSGGGAAAETGEDSVASESFDELDELPGSMGPSASEWVTAQPARAPSDWHCVCYLDPKTDVEKTACRQTANQCAGLLKVINSSSKSRLAPSEGTQLGCFVVEDVPYPWDGLGRADLWGRSSKEGGHLARGMCLHP